MLLDFNMAVWYDKFFLDALIPFLMNLKVSASGDGKLILWDIESGERLRTFEGHNRGLACIEYKVGCPHSCS
jgi:WD40 repeat protein